MKTNALLNLISHQPDIDKLYVYSIDLYEAKYQLLIKKHEGVGLKHCNDPKGFIEFSNYIDYIYENIEEHNPFKEQKLLIVFDDMIADKLSNTKIQQIVTEMFLRGRKLNVCLFYRILSYCTKRY